MLRGGLALSTQTKQRIIGGLVLLALLAIFFPLFLNTPHPSAALVKRTPGPPDAPKVELSLPQVATAEPYPGTVDVAQSPATQLPAVPPSSNQTIVASTQPETVAAKPKAALSKQSPKVVMAEVKPKPKVMPRKQHQPSLAAKVNNKYQQLLTAKAWVVQLASFSDAANAKRFVVKLRKAGYQAYKRSHSSGARVVHQVMVGPEISRQRAQQLQTQLQKHYHLNGMVRRYQA